VAPERLAGLALALAFWIPLAICTYLAFDPSPPESVFRVSDVALHAFAFTYLTFALSLAHRHQHWLLPAAWMLAYGLFIEFVQAFEPERSAELKDLLVDSAGICLGLLLVRWFGAGVRTIAVRLVGLVGASGP
jgi:VanZ family protein